MKSLQIILFTVITGTTYAQNTIGGWLMYWGVHPVGKSYEIYSEWQFRQKELPSTHEQLLFRTGFGRKINQNNSIGTGYGSISYYKNSNEWSAPDAMEHRWWGQWVNQKRNGANILEHRLRTEYRWLEGATPWRWRYRVMWIFPIHVFHPNNDALVIHLSNELFVHNNDSFFDRNRVYAAVGYHCNTHCEIQMGYLHQTVHRQAAGQYIQLGFLIH